MQSRPPVFLVLQFILCEINYWGFIFVNLAPLNLSRVFHGVLKAAISYSYVVGVLFLWDCHNRVPQSRGGEAGMVVSITEMYFLTVLEAGLYNQGWGRAGSSRASHGPAS